MRRLFVALALLASLAVAACTPGGVSTSPAASDLPVVSPETSMPAESEAPVESMPAESEAPVESMSLAPSPEVSTTP